MQLISMLKGTEVQSQAVWINWSHTLLYSTPTLKDITLALIVLYCTSINSTEE